MDDQFNDKDFSMAFDQTFKQFTERIAQQYAYLRSAAAYNEVKRRAQSGEFWTFIFSKQFGAFYLHIGKKYYPEYGTGNDENAKCCIDTCRACLGHTFLVACLRKSKMSAEQLQRELEQLQRELKEQLNEDYTIEQITNGQAIILSEPRLQVFAEHIRRHHLFDQKEEEPEGSWIPAEI